jgi:hydroxypyruvate isomerase
VPARLAANISLLFTNVPYLQRPAAAAAAGFTAIETWWPFGADPEPTKSQVDDFLAAISGAGVELVALNFLAGDMPAGERGVISLPDRAGEFRKSTDIVVRISGETGCRLFNALYGVRDERFSAGEQDETALANLRYAARAVGSAGGTVLLEALAEGENGAYPLTAPADVARVIGDCAENNVAMLADFYHFARNGYDFASVLDDYSPLIAHVQVADAPGRHEPGTGDIDFAALFRAVGATGYTGWIGAEYRPLGDTTEGLSWVPEFGLTLGGKAES